MFNWRDIKNPQSGGAEVYTHQIMKRLVSKGHNVTIFSSMFENGLREEQMDGVTVVRSGSKFSVYRKARQFYRSSGARYDVIIDEINTVPFMTPKFVKRGERIVALIHQLAREFWYHEMPYPVAWMGATLKIHGRHDPCIAPRAVPVMEAVCGLAVLDSWLAWPPEAHPERQFAAFHLNQ